MSGKEKQFQSGKSIDIGFTRRRLLAGAALMALSRSSPALAASRPKITIYKNASCDCCQKWADHLLAAGFETELIDRGALTALKTEWKIPSKLHACHTGKIDSYVIEGHVPASAIKRLLAERPQAIGLAVPGMPIGSPGMEGGQAETYDVIVFGRGFERSFARYKGSDAVL